MVTLGRDVHQRVSVLWFWIITAKHLKTATIRGGRNRLCATWLKRGKPFQICDEGSCGYGAFQDRLARMAKGVGVARAGHAPQTVGRSCLAVGPSVRRSEEAL
jgi:hypothetical protein